MFSRIVSQQYSDPKQNEEQLTANYIVTEIMSVTLLCSFNLCSLNLSGSGSISLHIGHLSAINSIVSRTKQRNGKMNIEICGFRR